MKNLILAVLPLFLLVFTCLDANKPVEKPDKKSASIDLSKGGIVSLSDLHNRAKQEDPQAQYALAHLFDQGASVQANKKLAQTLFSKSCKAKYSPACYFLTMNRKRSGSPEYLKLLRFTAKLGHGQAQYDLLDINPPLAGSPGDVSDFEWHLKQANSGNLEAMLYVAESYLRGEPVSQDFQKGVKILNDAANKNHAPSMYKYALTIALNSPKQIQMAVEWYKRSAQEGFAPAMMDLGILYAKGQGVPRDATKSLQWYLKAAKNHLVGAQTNLGTHYFNAGKLKKNSVLAGKG